MVNRRNVAARAASCAAALAGALVFAWPEAAVRAAAYKPIVFREEALPAGTPAGWHAVTFVIPGQVISGVVTRFTLERQSWSLAGASLHFRLGRGSAHAPSHVLLPPNVPLPSGVRRISHRAPAGAR